MQRRRIELSGQLHAQADVLPRRLRRQFGSFRGEKYRFLCPESKCNPSVVQPTGAHLPYRLL